MALVPGATAPGRTHTRRLQSYEGLSGKGGKYLVTHARGIGDCA